MEVINAAKASPGKVTFGSSALVAQLIGEQIKQAYGVDMVVNRLLMTHRGRPEEVVAQALAQSLRSMGVVPNKRQVAAYAAQIAELPPLPPAD